MEENLKLFNEDTRFVSSYKEAKIITKEDYFQLSMLLDGTERIYTFNTFEEAYEKYNTLLRNDKNGVYV